MRCFSSIFLLTAAVAAASSPVHVPRRTADEVLIFEDTFNILNLTVWKHELTLAGEGGLLFPFLWEWGSPPPRAHLPDPSYQGTIIGTLKCA